MSAMSLLTELRRRHVYRVAVVYAGVAWLLLQLGSILLPAFQAPDWFMRMLFGLLLIGMPVALALAWVFELTPEGMRRTEPTHSDEARLPEHGRAVAKYLVTTIIAVLALAVMALAGQQFVLRVEPDPALASDAKRAVTTIPAKSIVVLPFENESGGPDDRYFSDGLTEELIAALAQFHTLKVIGRHSSFRFRGTRKDSRAIGAQLGVATLLEGSVRTQDDRVRIVVGLINATDGRALWSHIYETKLRDIFATQVSIAGAVAQALKVELLGARPVAGDKPPSGNIQAYRAYLRGRFYSARYTAEDDRKAVDYLTRAIILDPHYALAYAKLASTAEQLAAVFLGGAEQQRMYARARVAADTALALDPNQAQAHLARGTLRSVADFDQAGALVEFQRAAELAPDDATIETGLGDQLMRMGRVEEGVAWIRRALTTEPLNGVYHASLAAGLLALDRPDEAEQAIGEAIQLLPEAGSLHVRLAMIDIRRGDVGAALRDAAAETSEVWRAYATALAYAASDDRKRADAALKTLIDKYGSVAIYQIASVFGARHQPDKMFAWLDRAWAQHDPGINQLLYDPTLLPYAHDPRFAAFCKKVGLPAPRIAGQAGI